MDQKELLIQQVRGLPITASCALVEAGHIYSGLIPDVSERLSMEIGTHVSSVLTELGMQVGTMLFVDDYNRTGDTHHTIERTIIAGSEVGFVPGQVVLEKDLIPQAQILIDKLSESNAIVRRKSRIRYLVGRMQDGRYEYFIDLKIGSKYTCEALDAALYLEKANQTGNGLLVTVLPDDYKGQQNRTKDLVRAVGCNAPILNVYFDKEGKIEVDLDY